MKQTILIVDDEKSIRFAFSRALEADGFLTYDAGTGKEALSLAEKNIPDLILLDMKLPDTSGLDLLKTIKEKYPQCIVIMMTAFGDVSLAVEAMQLGAENFRTKPFDVEEMRDCIKRSLEIQSKQSELESYKEEERKRYAFQDMVGNSSAILNVQTLIKKVASSPSTTVLIQGPSGTGKELVARAIHFNSSRRDRRFIEVNCTAIPESLLESELFGHEKGSFTDAKAEHKGIFEQADGGTLFLDEIGDMPLQMQAKLLRVLQEKRFKRIGSSRDLMVDVRVIASTNVDLEKAVKNGDFREDLFYRLKVVPINMPPLNERDNDPLLIAQYYLKKYSKEFRKTFLGFTKQCEELILKYSWPGNIRELKNVIERSVLLEEGEFMTTHQLGLEGKHTYEGEEEPGSISQNIDDIAKENFDQIEKATIQETANMTQATSPSCNHTQITLNVSSYLLEDVEKALLTEVLKQNKWNRNAVAKIVGINRTTLYSKIKKYDLEK